MNGLRVSGYGHPIRQDIIEGILQREEQLVKSGKPRYRTRKEIKEEKAARDDRFVNTWFLRGTTTSILKVQATPGGALARKVRGKLVGVLAPDGGTTQVVEGAGKGVLAGLKKADPCLKPGCQFGDSGELEQCMVDGKQTCWAARVVYCLKCTLCNATYAGTTGLTLTEKTRKLMHPTPVGHEHEIADALENGPSRSGRSVHTATTIN